MAKTLYEDRTLAVSLADVKTYLRITHTNDDTVITTLIRAAMAFVENACDALFTDDCDIDEISDFFNNEELASKWTAEGTVSEEDHPGALVVESGGEGPADMYGAWQRITGNFDIRVHCKTPSAMGTDSGVSIVAKLDDDNAVSARYVRAGAAAHFLARYDEDEGAEYSVTTAHATVTDFYLRLRRSGGRFWAYGKTWNTDAWTEIPPVAGQELLSSGPVQLWLAGYHGATAFEAWFDWIVENSEYASFPLPWCYGGSSSGSGHRVWGECGEPICCMPMWVHPCTGETTLIPYPIQAAIMEMVRRMYDNRGGIQAENVAGWAGTWLMLMDSDIMRLIDPFRTVGM